MEYVNYVDCICYMYTPYDRHDNRHDDKNIIIYDKKQCLNCLPILNLFEYHRIINIRYILLDLYTQLFLLFLSPFIYIRDISEYIHNQTYPYTVYFPDMPLLIFEEYIGIHNSIILISSIANLSRNIITNICSIIEIIIDIFGAPYFNIHPSKDTVILIRNINVYDIIKKIFYIILFMILFMIFILSIVLAPYR